ncbi:DUF4062 domain-containing protein [Thiomicrorhabdus sp. 6S3-12]|uniref:DUF4062 domain-containing protein n=1 Tax=Thiomicrorhabdus sp. 6S3-12 TaxID=2819681 RepID=UPI001AACE9D3|nr:DUF4062 domain-containing protein [Thiomicrorhabdus sp. 6S3-12]MBO1924770.1 DUF4062 domain-containing protein [Thiomicrorhabdus sp. 6S3-12]
MARTCTILKVFIASPSDVQPEREVVLNAINEINRTWSTHHNVMLELIKWETHTRPAIGKYPQEVINSQIGDDFDIFVGVLWGRYGTPTPKANSGTEEEFTRALDRYKKGENIEIMFYFKDAGIAPSKLDTEQVAKIQDFKNELSNTHGALYQQFETTDDFETNIRIHLTDILKKWLQGNNSISLNSDKNKYDSSDPLLNLNSLDELDADLEENIEALVTKSNLAMNEVSVIVHRLTDFTLELKSKFELRTQEIYQATEKSNFLEILEITSKSAKDIEFFTTNLSKEIPNLHTQNLTFAEAFTKIAIILAPYLNKSEIPDYLRELINYKKSVLTTLEQLITFQNVIKNMPSLTSEFTRSKRRAVAVLEDLLNQLNNSAKQIIKIEELFSSI